MGKVFVGFRDSTQPTINQPFGVSQKLPLLLILIVSKNNGKTNTRGYFNR